MGRPGTFQKGNKAAVGNPGPGPRPRIITDVIIAKLNSVDMKDPQRRAIVWRFVDELFEHAMSKDVTTTSKSGKKTVTKVLGDLSAMAHIMDRAEGRATQKVAADDGSGASGSVTIVFGPADKGVL